MPDNLFPYPGNKAQHSEWVIEHLPEHKCYVEPFGGAAGVLLNKPESSIEVYNDLDGDLVHFFEVLRDRPEELKEWLSRVPFSRKLHEEWKERFYNGERYEDDVKRAGVFFALRYMQFGGKYHGTSGFSTGTYHRDHAGQFQDKARSLDRFADRLVGVTIENLPFDEVIDQYDSKETVFYIDPPYEETKGNYNGLGDFSHEKLYYALEDIDGKFVLSHDSLPTFYNDGYDVVSKSSTFRIDSAGGNKDATEYLIMNFDSNGESLMSGVGQQSLEEFGLADD